MRTATVADLADIVSCLNLAFEPPAGTDFAASDDAQLARNLTTQIREGSIRLICDDRDVLGYISFWPAADQMFIDTLAVLPAHHRQGLGRKLLAHVDWETSRAGLSAISLFTKTAMAGNLHFYKRCGFRETGRCDDDGFSRVFYTKTLPGLYAAAAGVRTGF